jgi:dTDP-4-amino-4,6-dideoxygalactose transaminase
MNQSVVPDIDDLIEKLKEIFGSRWLTNFGEVHAEFQRELEKTLESPHVLPVTNATFGLFAVMKALDIREEVITVPFTFPATYNVLFNMNEIQPVFVDVSRESFCIQPEKVREAVTKNTRAILAVHAYGFPCDIESLKQIADDFRLRLIYDAAPCFGVKIKGESLCHFGDAAVLSFHATKVFNTAEGGAIVCQDNEIYARCRLFINFGIQDEESLATTGMNGKLDEIRSAIGLVNLREVESAVSRRKAVVDRYLAFFRSEQIENIQINHHLYENPDVSLNYAYFPMIVNPTSSMNRDILYSKLKESGIFTRKYYYPTILDHSFYERFHARFEDMTNAAFLSRNVLCLPVNPYFEEKDCQYIIDRLSSLLREH